jgi:hypothetical protein
MDSFWKFATFAVALAAAFIAYQQFWLAKERLKLDLFAKRFAVFAATRAFLSKILQHTTTRLEDLAEYRRDVAEASFLFDDDVVGFLNEIDRRGLHLWTLNETRQGTQAGEESKKLARESSEELSWLASRLPMLKPTFEPYMKFSEWRWGLWRRKEQR